MARGIASLRGYQWGGGIGDPGDDWDDWLEELIRQLQRRANIKGLPDDPSMMRFFPNIDADDLIHLSNFDIEWDGDKKMRMGLGPEPHVVPPLSNTPDLGDVLDNLDNLGKSLEESKKGVSSIVDDFLRNVLGYSEEEVVQWHIKELIGRDSPPQNMNILDQPIHELDEAFRSGSRFDWGQSRDLHGESIDDLIRGAGGRPELHKFPLPPLATRDISSHLAKLKDIEREAAAVASVERTVQNVASMYEQSRLDRRGGIGSLFNRLTSGLPKWGSIAAPFLGAAAAAAVSPLALAAEQAFDFAISPTDIPREGSQPRNTYMSQREMDWEDLQEGRISIEEFIGMHGSGPDYSANPLSRSTSSQRAIEQLIRNARAGTSVNRYRR